MRKLVVITLIMIISESFGIDRTERWIMNFGRQNSPRSEAMGRGMVAVADGIYSATQNPALLTSLEGIETVYSHSSPFYLVEKGKYDNIGIGYNYADFIYAAFSMHQFNDNMGFVRTDENGNESYKVSDWINRDYDISLASKYSLNDDFELAAGINFNIIRDEWGGENGHSDFSKNRLSLDIGFNLLSQANSYVKYNLGASLTNVTKTVYEEVNNTEYPDWELPQIARIGCTVEFTDEEAINSSINLVPLKALLTCQYQYVLNDDVRDGFSIGSEIQFFEVINFRTGYYEERVEEKKSESNTEWFKEVTYGFGVKLPLAKISNNMIPLNASFDMTVLPQPSYSKLFTGWDDFTSYAFKLNYLL